MLVLLRLLAAIAIAFLCGRLIAKLRLPSILGWLIAAMILGPHALSLITQDLLDSGWYQNMIHVMECAVGLMIGTELVWNKIKCSGKAIVITTLTQSLGTFFLVSAVFAVVFYFSGIPVYLALIFGGIALATAPAPALSIVREFKTDGPVTKTLIPMAALDDIVGCVVFFSVIAIVAGKLSAGQMPIYVIPLMVVLPLVIGAVMGYIAGLFLKKEQNDRTTLAVLIAWILITSGVGFFFNYVVMPSPVLNFMLIGMAFSAAFSNMVSESRLEQIMKVFSPILNILMIFVITNLGAPLDYHLMLGARAFTAIYILSRAAGKYLGAYFGAAITKSPETVKKYLGLTLLPHSGVSLVFTGVAVSVLGGSAPECAQIVQGTIAAAAVINEVIAVIVSKKGFEWAGEFGKGVHPQTEAEAAKAPEVIITISRQHGSGGREIGRRLAKELGIPFYDHELIDLATQSSDIDQSYFETAEESNVGGLLHELSADIRHDLSVEEKAFLHQAKIIRDVAEKSSCIIVGRCADYVLANRPLVFKVFVYADMESRKYRIEHIYKETDHPALMQLKATDEKRASYYRYYSGKNFGDAENYDLCLNSSTLGIDECVSIIKTHYLNMCSAPVHTAVQ